MRGYRFSPAERKDIDRFLWERRRVETRIKKIDSALSRVQKDGAVIRKHCDASQAEIQTAIRRYKKQLDDAEKGVLGVALMHHQMKETLRRLSPFGVRDVGGELKDILQDLPL